MSEAAPSRKKLAAACGVQRRLHMPVLQNARTGQVGVRFWWEAGLVQKHAYACFWFQLASAGSRVQ